MNNTFEGTHCSYQHKINLTIINTDKTLTEEDIAQCIQDCYIPDYLDVYIYDGTSNIESITTTRKIYLESLIGTVISKDVLQGRINHTIVIVPYNDPALRFVKPVGGFAWDTGGYVVHYYSDNSVDLGIKILHEFEHTLNLKADKLYSDKDEFQKWMIESNYEYKDFYENNYQYTSNNMYYKYNGGQQVMLDYHLWLLMKDCIH